MLALRSDADAELLESLQGQDLEEVEQAQQASVVRLVNEILTEAIETRASDIHVEAQEQRLKLRYRVDGVLQRQPTPPEMKSVSRRDCESPEDHGEIEHCGKARPAGRPYQIASEGARTSISVFRLFPCCMAKVSSCGSWTKRI